MTDTTNEPAVRMVGVDIKLGSGKPARIIVPEDMGAEDGLYMVRAVLDVTAQIINARLARENKIVLPDKKLVLPTN